MPQTNKKSGLKDDKNVRAFLAKAIGEDAESDAVMNMLREFRWNMTLYRCAIREVQTKFEVLDEELSISRVRNPIDRIESRVKSPESIADKLRRNNLEFSIASMRENLNDIAGLRIICQYIDDIYTVSDMLSKQDDITVIKVKDYIHSPKPNGYRSYHMVVTVPIYLNGEMVETKVEIQIRTVAMDFWASLEHKIYYKFEGDGPENLQQELKACADMVDMLDAKMFSLNERILLASGQERTKPDQE